MTVQEMIDHHVKDVDNLCEIIQDSPYLHVVLGAVKELQAVVNGGHYLGWSLDFNEIQSKLNRALLRNKIMHIETQDELHLIRP